MKITKQIRNHENKSLDQYFSDIGKIALLTPDEEIVLAVQIRRGDPAARNKLVAANLRFVVSVAKMYQNQGLSLEDLINEGNLGLINAAKRFDETRGFKFISYAVWWIRQGITTAIADQTRVVRLPINRMGNLTKLNKASKDLEQLLERKPTLEELSQSMGATTDEISFTIETSAHQLSIDAPVTSDMEYAKNLLDTLPNNHELPDVGLMKESLKKEIENILSTLDEREEQIIKLTFGIGSSHKATLEEIGYKFNLTRERIRQIKEKALRKLRNQKKSNSLKDYL